MTRGTKFPLKPEGPAGPGKLAHPLKGLKGRYTCGQTLVESGPSGGIDCFGPIRLCFSINGAFGSGTGSTGHAFEFPTKDEC